MFRELREVLESCSHRDASALLQLPALSTSVAAICDVKEAAGQQFVRLSDVRVCYPFDLQPIPYTLWMLYRQTEKKHGHKNRDSPFGTYGRIVTSSVSIPGMCGSVS